MSNSNLNKDNQTKQQIVDTAEELFKQFGYQKTTVADIAKKLGMSSANVYRYFVSKKAINEEVALRLTCEVEEACRDIAASSSSAGARLKKVLQNIHVMNRERYVQDAQMHEIVAAAMKDSWPIVQQHILNIDKIVASILEDGIAKGEFEPCDIDTTARCICTSMMRFSHPGLMLECEEMAIPTLEQLVEFILKALKSSK